jgi:hypothetical protein
MRKSLSQIATGENNVLSCRIFSPYQLYNDDRERDAKRYRNRNERESRRLKNSSYQTGFLRALIALLTTICAHTHMYQINC